MTDRYDENLILDYVEGDLSAEQRASFEAQLADDAALRELVGDLMADRTMLRAVAPEAAPPDLLEQVHERLERRMLLDDEPAVSGAIMTTEGRRWSNRWLAYAAVVALLLISAGIIIPSLVNINTKPGQPGQSTSSMANRSTGNDLTDPLLATKLGDATPDEATATGVSTRPAGEQPDLSTISQAQRPDDVNMHGKQGVLALGKQQQFALLSPLPMTPGNELATTSHEQSADATSPRALKGGKQESLMLPRSKGGGGELVQGGHGTGQPLGAMAGQDAKATALGGRVEPSVTQVQLVSDDPDATRKQLVQWASQRGYQPVVNTRHKKQQEHTAAVATPSPTSPSPTPGQSTAQQTQRHMPTKAALPSGTPVAHADMDVTLTMPADQVPLLLADLNNASHQHARLVAAGAGSATPPNAGPQTKTGVSAKQTTATKGAPDATQAPAVEQSRQKAPSKDEADTVGQGPAQSQVGANQPVNLPPGNVNVGVPATPPASPSLDQIDWASILSADLPLQPAAPVMPAAKMVTVNVHISKSPPSR